MSIFCDMPPEETPDPVFTSVSVAFNLATVTFNRDVCRESFWSSADWEVNVNGSPFFDDIADSIPVCNAEASNGVSSANLTLVAAAPPGSMVAVTLSTVGGAAIRDDNGNNAIAPQTRTTTATSAETTPPTLASASAAVGSTVLTLTFSEPVLCVAFAFDSTDIVITDNNPTTADPSATGAGPNACGATQGFADTSFSVQFSAAFPPNTTYTVVLTPEVNEIQDIFFNDLVSPAITIFTTEAADTSPPTLVDTQLISNLQTTDYGDVGDAFQATFSEVMNALGFGSMTLQDGDGSFANVQCGAQLSCVWDAAGTIMTVTTVQFFVPLGGTTPGLQIPTTITTLNGVSDLQGNLPNLSGSPDRLIDNETITGPFAPPGVTDSRMLNNLGTTDFGEPGDSFRATFSAATNTNTSAAILVHDPDGSGAIINCGLNAVCAWDTTGTTLTVTVMTILAPPFPGTTPGVQIPMRLAMLAGISDLNGNVPDLAGSPDTVIDFE